MDNAKQHWEILQGLGNELAKKVREFMVIGDKGDGVIVATENGQGFWLGEMEFEGKSKQAMEPTRLDVPNLSSMAQGRGHILLLTESGQIYAMGQNDKGQLGLGTFDQRTRFSPQLISIPHKFISVRCGYWHSVALTEDGKVWAWGRNYFGQVGLPDSTVAISSLHKISDLNPHRVVAVECGEDHSLALTDLGEVYGWGYNGWGQLGDGSKSTRHTPTRMLIPRPVQSMAAGYNHTLLLTLAGEVWACGKNKFGQLGLPTTTESSTGLSKVACLPPISQIASHPYTNLSIAMTSGHRCFVWGQLANKTLISTPRNLSPLYSTVESPLSSFSTYRSTPHSISLPATKCPHRTDSTTQTDKCSDSVSVQTMPSPNRVLERMFNNPDSSPDVRFQVGDQTILAHRSVLQTTSGHFHRLFSSQLADFNTLSFSNSQSVPNPTRHTTNPSEPDANSTIPTTPQCSKITIPISDHSYPALHAYLRYLYLGILEVAPEHLADLFSLSMVYLESHLQQLCLSRMRTTLSPVSCCLYYPLTYRHSLPELSAFQQELVQFISTRTSEVYGTAAYQSMDGDLCKKLSIRLSRQEGPNGKLTKQNKILKWDIIIRQYTKFHKKISTGCQKLRGCQF